jgi:hypothetical protein
MVDPWEMAGLGTAYLLVACAFFVFLQFFGKFLRTRKTTRELLPFLGLTILALFISISFFIVSWFDYFRWEGVGEFLLLYKLQNLLNLAAFAAVTFFWEYVLKKTKYIITAYMLVGTTLYFVLSIIMGRLEDLQASSTYILIFGVPLFILCTPIWYLVFIRPTSGFLRRRMLLSYVGFFSVGIGLIGRNDLFIEILGIYMYTVGTTIIIIGIALVGYGFAAFSTFTDLKWKQKLREIFVISHNGVCLYAYSFEQNIPLEDSQLIAGGFSGIQLLLSEMVKTEETLQLIDYQNVKIMVEQGENAMSVMIINEESSFLQYKLKLFSEEFQNLFKDLLDHWAGEIEVFTPTRAIIQRIFELDTEI